MNPVPKENLLDEANFENSSKVHVSKTKLITEVK